MSTMSNYGDCLIQLNKIVWTTVVPMST